MPSFPNVPHIVGDDDEEVEEQSTDFTILPERTYSRTRKTPDYESEEEDADSWYNNTSENENGDNEESSTYSSGDDWMGSGYGTSNNLAPEPPIESIMDFCSTEFNEPESAEPESTKPESTKPDSTQPEPAEPETVKQVAPNDDNHIDMDNLTALEVLPFSNIDAAELVTARRNSLRSATRNKVKQLSKETSKNSPLRQHRTKLVKAIRRTFKHNKREVGHKAATVGLRLAKPLEVTQYFNKISANLVRERVALFPFLKMREHIDRLVEEAIATTKKGHTN